MDGHAVEVVGEIGTARAALAPARSEHEVVDDELTAVVEEAGEGLRAARPFEQILLFDSLPGEFAALPAELIAQPREFFLFRQELLPGFGPFVMRDGLVGMNFGQAGGHHDPPSSGWWGMDFRRLSCER